MTNEWIFLGSGGSMGIPVIGCKCTVCTSKKTHNQRLRPSILLKIGGKNLLIDATPDLRTQALRENLQTLNAVLITHLHHDHTGGLDDLRVFSMRTQKPIPLITSTVTAHDLQSRFSYMFQDFSLEKNLLPKFSVVLCEGERGILDFEGIPIRYFSYEQVGIPVLGFRFGPIAYVTDIRKYSDAIFADLNGVDILILSALRFTPSPLHLSVDEAVCFAEKVRAKQTWLTHLAHELDHEKTNAYLPPNIQLSYDGLRFSF